MRHKHGGDFIAFGQENGYYPLDFSINLNPLGMSPRAKEAIVDLLAEPQRYPDPKNRKLKAKLADITELPQEYIVCGNGASDIIYRLVQAKKPKKALLAVPTFAEYEHALNNVDCQVEYYFLSEDTGFILDMKFLDCLTKDIDIVFLCNPNNPTGALIEQEVIVEILKKTKEQQIFLVMDECFNALLEKPEEATLRPFLADNPQLFIVDALTKSYSLAALRLGYGFSADILLINMLETIVQPWSVSGYAEVAALASLDDPDHLLKARELLTKQRLHMSLALSEIGLTIFPSTINYLLFRCFKPGLSQFLATKGIMIRSCANFKGLDESYYRVAIRRAEENARLISALHQFILGEGDL